MAMRPAILSAVRLINSGRAFTRSSVRLMSNKRDPDPERQGYVILAPDTPSDTEENNALLRIPSIEKRIEFDEITPYKSVRAFMKRLIVFESLLDELEQGALTGKSALTLEQVIEKMDQHLVPLTYAFSTLSLLTGVQTDVHKYRIADTAAEAFDDARRRRFQIVEIYTFLQQEYSDPHTSRNRFNKRWAEKYMLEGKLHGLGKSKDDVDLVQSQMQIHVSDFLENVNKANELIHEFIISPSVLITLPVGFISKDTRIWSPYDNSISTRFLQSCSNRSVRKNFFDNYNQRCHKKATHKQINSVTIEELRDKRKNYAVYLGYDNFVSLSMETKMAGFVTNVKTMLNTLHLRCQTTLEKDLKELSDLARKSSGGKVDKLELWDLDYYRALYMTETTGPASEAMKANFPLNSVLKSVFNLCSRLFQVDIVECEGRSKFPSWDPSVRLFDVFSPNAYHGSFYLDPYVRTGKSMTGFARTHFLLPRSDALPAKALSALIMSLPQPMIKDQDIRLSFDEVIKLFGCFGTLMQHTLTDVPHSDINGLSNLEWDMVNMMSDFMSLWPLYDLKTLADCAAGSETVISNELQTGIAERHFKFNSISLMPELYKSALDLTLHSNPDFWQDLVYEIWDIYMKPFVLEKKDFHMCAGSEIICQSPAAYYCPLWSKMVAADLFTSFEDKLQDEEKLSQQGLKLRETFLSESGATPSSEMFKALMERNPSAESLIRLSKSCIVYDSTTH